MKERRAMRDKLGDWTRDEKMAREGIKGRKERRGQEWREEREIRRG